LERSARSGTSSTYIDCRSGKSNAETVPSHTDNTIRCQTSMRPVATSIACNAASSSIIPCVSSNAFCRGTRSAKTPANVLKRSRKLMLEKKATTPRNSAEWVSW